MNCVNHIIIKPSQNAKSLLIYDILLIDDKNPGWKHTHISNQSPNQFEF